MRASATWWRRARPTISRTPEPPLRLSAAVAAAREEGRAIVALESSVLAQGLPEPANREAHTRMCAAITARGATPAVTAVVAGTLTVGLDGDPLERFLRRDGVAKVSARDLPVAIARGTDGATTVAASLACCVAAGLPVFATGGIGGVHREPPFDESADLAELGNSPVIVVCAGAKSILDLPATLERLETHGVIVVGYRTREFPGFFTATTGLEVPVTVETVAEIVAIDRAARALGRRSAVLVVQPPPADSALDKDEVDQAVERALGKAKQVGVRGGALTPFLLEGVLRATEGRSLQANLALLEANAALAAEIAVTHITSH